MHDEWTKFNNGEERVYCVIDFLPNTGIDSLQYVHWNSINLLLLEMDQYLMQSKGRPSNFIVILSPALTKGQLQSIAEQPNVPVNFNTSNESSYPA